MGHASSEYTVVMLVIANGKERPAADGTTVSQFVGTLDLDPKYVIVELNGDALAREHFEGTRLSDGDRLEIVRAVAGG